MTASSGIKLEDKDINEGLLRQKSIDNITCVCVGVSLSMGIFGRVEVGCWKEEE